MHLHLKHLNHQGGYGLIQLIFKELGLILKHCIFINAMIICTTIIEVSIIG